MVACACFCFDIFSQRRPCRSAALGCPQSVPAWKREGRVWHFVVGQTLWASRISEVILSGTGLGLEVGSLGAEVSAHDRARAVKREHDKKARGFLTHQTTHGSAVQVDVGSGFSDTMDPMAKDPTQYATLDKVRLWSWARSNFMLCSGSCGGLARCFCLFGLTLIGRCLASSLLCHCCATRRTIARMLPMRWQCSSERDGAFRKRPWGP